MTIPTERQIRTVIQKNYDLAIEGINSGTTGIKKLAKFDESFANSIEHIKKSKITGVRHLEHVAILSMDLRESTSITEKNRIDDLFVSIHCFLPMVSFLTSKLSGEILGLRGDGLMAAFGIGEASTKVCVNSAYTAGMVMIEATMDILNPFLNYRNIPIQFTLGGAIDFGQVAFTKIGFEDTTEVTGYGVPMNTASKNANGSRQLWISAEAMRVSETTSSPKTYTQSSQRIQRDF